MRSAMPRSWRLPALQVQKVQKVHFREESPEKVVSHFQEAFYWPGIFGWWVRIWI
jgi:hypothetical protein